MTRYTLTHLSDRVLLRDLTDLVARDRATTAELLAHLAEVDARRLYLPAGYPSLFAWCVGVLGFSEDTAYKRIRAARAARQHPAIFAALADGRLSLSAVVLLAPHLTPDHAGALLAGAERRSNAEVERLLAERFPRPDVPTVVRAIAPVPSGNPLAARPVQDSVNPLALAPMDAGIGAAAVAPATAGGIGMAATPVPERSEPSVPSPAGVASGEAADAAERRAAPPLREPAPADIARARLAPLAPGRFALQATLGQETHDLLRRAQALLGHAVPSGDVDQVLNRALGLLVRQLERRKCAAAARPRAARPRAGGPPRSAAPRRIPAAVRRAVWERDRGRCTFVGENGHRCEARARLENDHVEPAARGGQASVMNLRLRCRAHNQYEARRAFGAGLVERRRDEAMRARAERREAMRGGAERRAAPAGGRRPAVDAVRSRAPAG